MIQVHAVQESMRLLCLSGFVLVFAHTELGIVFADAELHCHLRARGERRSVRFCPRPLPPGCGDPFASVLTS